MKCIVIAFEDDGFRYLFVKQPIEEVGLALDMPLESLETPQGVIDAVTGAKDGVDYVVWQNPSIVKFEEYVRDTDYAMDYEQIMLDMGVTRQTVARWVRLSLRVTTTRPGPGKPAKFVYKELPGLE